MIELDRFSMIDTIRKDDQLRGPQKWVLINFVIHFDAMGEARINYTSISRECGYHITTVSKIIDELVNLEWLKKGEDCYLPGINFFQNKPSFFRNEPIENRNKPAKYRNRAKSDHRRIELSEEDMNTLINLLYQEDHDLTILQQAKDDKNLLPKIDVINDLLYRLKEFKETRYVKVSK